MKENIIEDLFEIVKNKGELSEKQNILDSDSKVYTKKINLNLKMEDGLTVKVVALSGFKKDLSDATVRDLRICTTERNGEWCNSYANQLDENFLTKIKDEIL